MHKSETQKDGEEWGEEKASKQVQSSLLYEALQI